jgi:hypothetical protein
MTHPGIRPSATNSLLFAGRSLPPTLADQDNWHVSRRISHDHDLDSAPARGQMTEMADAIAKTICVYPLRAPFHASEFRVAVVSTRLLPCYAPCFGATRTSVSTATHGFPRVSISVQLVGLRSRVRKFESCWGRFHPRRSACAQAAPGRLIFLSTSHQPKKTRRPLCPRVERRRKQRTGVVGAGADGGDVGQPDEVRGDSWHPPAAHWDFGADFCVCQSDACRHVNKPENAQAQDMPSPLPAPFLAQPLGSSAPGLWRSTRGALAPPTHTSSSPGAARCAGRVRGADQPRR